MNKVQIDGRLTRDPEITYSQYGKCFAKFTLACYIKQRGEDSTMFVPCVAFGEMAEKIGDNCHKGTKLIVETGTLRIEKSIKDPSRTWTTITVWDAKWEQPKGDSKKQDEDSFSSMGEDLGETFGGKFPPDEEISF